MVIAIPVSGEITGTGKIIRGTEGRSLQVKALNRDLIASAAFFARFTRFMKNSLIIV